MKRFFSALLILLTAFCLRLDAAEVAAFTLNNGAVRQALFEVMKNNFIYVRIPKQDGSYLKLRFHKSLVRRVVFLNGKELNLTNSNSTPELNDRELVSFRRLAFDHKTIVSPQDFPTFQEEIAVRRLTASGISDSEAGALTNVLRGELAKTGRYRVMEREQMVEVLKEQAFQQTGVCDEECVVEMGQLLGVKNIVVGNVSEVEKGYSVNVRMVDVATGKILKDIHQVHRGSSDRLMTHTMPSMAQRISGMYSPKRLDRKYFIAGAIVLGSLAVAVPVIMNVRKPEAEEAERGDLLVEW